MAEPFDAQRQLRSLLGRFPRDPVEIRGVLLDYIGQSGERLETALERNMDVYRHCFVNVDEVEARALLEALIDGPEERERLRVACQENFPRIAALLGSGSTPSDGSSTRATWIAENPTGVLGFSPQGVFWQISDIHFGKFNMVENDPHELAARLAKVAVDFPHVRPQAIVVTGDVSSIGERSEFESYLTFCEEINATFSVPILTIPGNHDVRWLEDGTADRMRGFRETVGASPTTITPFKPTNRIDYGAGLAIEYSDENDDRAPLASVTIASLDLQFVLLVSGYYSGEIPDTVRNVLSDALNTKEDLEAAIKTLNREDQGSVSQEYVTRIATLLSATSSTRVGLIHHNPIGYGVQPCANPYATQLRETLFDRSARVILHGHVHLSEEKSDIAREPEVGRAFPIPCATLTSVCTAGTRGMNVCFVGRDETGQRQLGVAHWAPAGSAHFRREGLELHYRVPI